MDGSMVGALDLISYRGSSALQNTSGSDETGQLATTRKRGEGHYYYLLLETDENFPITWVGVFVFTPERCFTRDIIWFVCLRDRLLKRGSG